MADIVTREAVKTQLAAWAGTRVPAGQFLDLIEQSLSGGDEWPLTEWHQIVEFAADQSGRWQVAWLFSRASAPDVSAKTESELWGKAWQMAVDTLAAHMPDEDAIPTLTTVRRLLAVEHALKARLESLEGRPVASAAVRALSHIAIGLSRIGMTSIGARLYTVSLYPPASVGRG